MNSVGCEPLVKLGRAWLLLCGALALHVFDEASTGFLQVYNPTVMAIRQQLPWLPLPVFRFDVWIVGLIVAIIALVLLSPLIFRGVGWTRVAGYVLAIFMMANAAGHTLGTMAGRTVSSVRFEGPMPGFYSSPVLLAASVYLLFRLQTSANRRQSG